MVGSYYLLIKSLLIEVSFLQTSMCLFKSDRTKTFETLVFWKGTDRLERPTSTSVKGQSMQCTYTM